MTPRRTPRLLRVALATAAYLSAPACGGPPAGGAAQGPRAIDVAPAPDAGAAVAVPDPPASRGEEVAAFELALGTNQVCVRLSGRVHCSTDLAPDQALASVPPLEGIEDAVSVALGHDFGCAATRAGTVMCFGDNTYGQLGAGLRAPRSDKPVRVIGVAGAKRVVAGAAHACALLGDGTVRCWGRNASGQTGSATSYLPAAHELVTAEPVEGVKDVMSLAAGGTTTCAVGRDQQVTCWGQALLGRSDGLGSPRQNERPTEVPSLARMESLAASDGAFCGIRNGEVFCWGETWSLFKSSAIGASKMVRVDVPRAKRVAMTKSHACAVLLDGGVMCWGGNYYGGLGRGETAGFDALPPELVKGLPFAVDVAVGGSMSCAIAAAREVYCWGSWPHAGHGEHKQATPVKILVDGTTR